MKSSRLCSAICAVLINTTVLSFPVFAQMNSDYPQKHGGATADNPRAANNPDAVPNPMLRQTAAAYVRVQRLSAAKPLSESEKMKAIKSAGMEPVQYKHVMMLVQTDKTLRHKFLQDVQEEGGHAPAQPSY